MDAKTVSRTGEHLVALMVDWKVEKRDKKLVDQLGHMS